MQPPERPDDGIYVNLPDLLSQWTLGQAHGDGPPGCLTRPSNDRPVAILFRQVASPSYETAWFARKARRCGCSPVVIEHRTDRFSVHNPYKRSLVTVRIVVGRDRHGRAIIRQQKLVDHNSAEGRPLDAIATASGEGLVAYHHRKLRMIMGAEAPRILDLSEVVATAADGARAYYVDVFKLLAGRAVLFEDFVVDDRTASFFARVVRPAYEQALRAAGRRPQIVRLTQGLRASSPLWYAYPPAMADDQQRASQEREGVLHVG